MLRARAVTRVGALSALGKLFQRGPTPKLAMVLIGSVFGYFSHGCAALVESVQGLYKIAGRSTEPHNSGGEATRSTRH